MTNLDRDTMLRRTQEIRIFVQELQKLSSISREDFLKNNERQYAVMHLLQLAIECCLSASNHIVSRKRLGIPKNYQDVFALMEKGGLLTSEFTKEMMKMARFRNRLVHVYWEMDVAQVYDILTTKLDDFEQFANILAKLI